MPNYIMPNGHNTIHRFAKPLKADKPSLAFRRLLEVRHFVVLVLGPATKSYHFVEYTVDDDDCSHMEASLVYDVVVYDQKRMRLFLEGQTMQC